MAKSTAAKNEAATAKAGLKTGTKLGTGTKVNKSAAKPASKPAKAPKEKAPKAEGEGGRRGRAPAWPLDAKIKVLVENPKRAGTASHDRFALYGKGTTVGAFLEAGGTSGDLHWDSEHEYISIG